MPRYSFRTLPLGETVQRHAMEIAARRFPEVDVLDCGSDDGRDDALTWVCRGPERRPRPTMGGGGASWLRPTSARWLADVPLTRLDDARLHTEGSGESA